MLTVIALVLSILTVSYVLEKKLNLPIGVMVMMGLAYAAKFYFPELSEELSENFDEITLAVLPLILIPDIMTLSLDKVKKNWKSILYFAVIVVIVSMIIGTVISKMFIFGPEITFGMGIALFAILSATDAVSVLNVFGKFELPKNLKVIAEGDSLGNDPVALILFKLIGISLIAGSVISSSIIIAGAVKVLLISLGVGFGVGFFGFYVLKYLQDSTFELIIIYLTSVLAFGISEEYHASGILAVIISIGFLKYSIDKEISEYENRVHDIKKFSGVLTRIKNTLSTTKDRLEENIKITNIIALFANSLIFIFMAFCIEFSTLLKYSFEIISIFILMSAIRFALTYIRMGALNKPFSWTVVLTFAGIKGGLSLIMVHFIPDTFLYKEMFVSIVVGNIILSTFVNTTGLILFLKYFEVKDRRE